ncbi:Protein N-acetyltransferase, RimJ/RimL family [Lentzea waywayandensis]|uniref:Protein N-acetyltransferase, RimJ/RimL family n=1 Tax=Lentzea waywayandensis TaxID=84724 RepID=A0A1I6E1M0_9PSEU|nr:GNAT family N-acetyltransferase [Lentzea waywayandensis]SFR11472.1 Protein N-acetyltransferase, RimJ/RimL family [Lentzea waywayandensis]
MDTLLRPWTPDDAPIILAASGEEMMDRQFTAQIDSLPAAEEWIALLTARRTDDVAYSFAVLHEGVPVGNVAVSSVERRHLTGWVSYWMREEARGKGLATKACLAVSEFAFSELGLFRLEIAHRLDNPASCRVATGAGYAVEGVERARLLYDGVRYDTETHARLATD